MRYTAQLRPRPDRGPNRYQLAVVAIDDAEGEVRSVLLFPHTEAENEWVTSREVALRHARRVQARHEAELNYRVEVAEL